MSNLAKRHLLRIVAELHPDWPELVCIHHLARLSELAERQSTAR